MTILTLFVRTANLSSLQQGNDVVEVAPSDQLPAEDHVVIREVRFESCPTCDDRGTYEKTGTGVATWGPCPTCRQSKKLP